MYKNILVPLDQSELAEGAIHTAIDMAEDFKARVILIHVFEIIPLLPKDRESEYKILKGRGEKYPPPGGR